MPPTTTVTGAVPVGGPYAQPASETSASVWPSIVIVAAVTSCRRGVAAAGAAPGAVTDGVVIGEPRPTAYLTKQRIYINRYQSDQAAPAAVTSAARSAVVSSRAAPAAAFSAM
jgi:hypothetical protein